MLKVQNYNAVLTLSHLYQTADAILTLDNDSLHQICSRLMNIKNVSFRCEACLQSNVGSDLNRFLTFGFVVIVVCSIVVVVTF